MLADIVVDTNVFVHANNPENSYSDESKAFAHTLLAADTALCLDEGFAADEARNRSRIAAEYWQHLSPGMLGHEVIQTLAAARRVRTVELPTDQNDKRTIRRLVPRDATDRAFLGTAIRSDDRVLVSHDFDDFSDDVRDEAEAEWHMRFVEALGASALLA
jgi:hypothetical protein